MDAPINGRPEMRVRSLFVSDLHLGCEYSQAGPFLEFLNCVDTRNLYLVGDIVDGWKLGRRRYWTADFTSALDSIVRLSASGVSVRYAIGNHDAFLRASPLFRRLARFGLIEISEEFEHITASGRRFLVLHGDQFDRWETGARWCWHLANALYSGLLFTNRAWQYLRGRHDHGQQSLSAQVKQRVHRLVQHIRDFESRLTCHARSRKYDGVVCGHVHAPQHSAADNFEYCNTGDWVENCTALVEHFDGRMQLLSFSQGTILACDLLPFACPNRAVPAQAC